MTKLQGKIIWITGASSGIGEELAYQLSAAGAKLILSARREAVLNSVKAQCQNPAEVNVLPLDINAFETMETVVEHALAINGKIDVLINNAGISQRSLIAETSFSVYKELMDTDYLGVVALSKALLGHFISQKSGHFVTVSSLMGKFSSPYRSGYCAAKHALHGFFDALRMEHEKDGILVTMVCPGFVQTNIAKSALIGDGTHQKYNDQATARGLDVSAFCKKMIRAMERKKYEVYIGGKEVQGIYLKRFFPKLLHKIVLKSKVR